ncbi:hypothetical protein PACID_14600 [Acidipropionibacterium acidipropionici ATCC 4875]|uniref:Uncharacterized protein n=1 Tax=Acidipropionibacterium acidipropionici (strain ATCC 4875 / DSM 20272 / JCM 6432 / NBRC 12425 / NCIMB 8070 / 4) TaxID=1171373 RepID=K7RMV3_ACIA4|nr:hypothetical protein [Acidipropionibacterium acidipropionici]AFV89274.1 hypothetical protein PACID_14600 [Acidipropionibacterium acidipropionici ATCC 4875]
MPSQKPPITYRPGPQMEEWLTEREQLRREDRSLSQAARDELVMMRELAEAELAAHTWTLTELETLSAALEGLPPDLAPTAQVASAVAARPGRTEPEVGGLAAHLGQLSPSADKALSYAVAAHRARGLAGDREGWAAVGVRAR